MVYYTTVWWETAGKPQTPAHALLSTTKNTQPVRSHTENKELSLLLKCASKNAFTMASAAEICTEDMIRNITVFGPDKTCS